MKVEELLDKAEEFIIQLPFSPNKEFYLVYVTSRRELDEIEKELYSKSFVYNNTFINKTGYFESILGRIYLAEDFGHEQKPYFAIRMRYEN